MRLVGLSTSVCGTGTFSAHTATHSTSENAHETQSFSPKSPAYQKAPALLFPIKNLRQYLIYHTRICFTLHRFHCLANQETNCFFLPCLIIGNRLWIFLYNLLNRFAQSSFVTDRTKSMLFDILLRVCILHWHTEDISR